MSFFFYNVSDMFFHSIIVTQVFCELPSFHSSIVIVSVFDISSFHSNLCNDRMLRRGLVKRLQRHALPKVSQKLHSIEEVLFIMVE